LDGEFRLIYLDPDDKYKVKYEKDTNNNVRIFAIIYITIKLLIAYNVFPDQTPGEILNIEFKGILYSKPYELDRGTMVIEYADSLNNFKN
jgi:hypothetical protein